MDSHTIYLAIICLLVSAIAFLLLWIWSLTRENELRDTVISNEMRAVNSLAPIIRELTRNRIPLSENERIEKMARCALQHVERSRAFHNVRLRQDLRELGNLEEARRC